jgi:hypothetical protein
MWRWAEIHFCCCNIFQWQQKSGGVATFDSSLFNEFFCKLGFFWLEWDSLKHLSQNKW